jgi:hypothetical protein
MKNALERGQTYFGTSGTTDVTGGVELEGMEVAFKHAGSGRMVKGRIMRNTGAATITGGMAVINAASYRGQRFDGKCHLNAQACAGVVDPALGTTGCRHDDLCIVFTTGPCSVYMGDQLIAVVEGDLAYAMTAATSGATTAGRIITLGATAAATAAITDGVAIAINRLGRAMSALTASQTAAAAYTLQLVDLDVH